MNSIDITGGMTLSALLTSFGKVVDKGARKITLTFDIVSTLKLVAQGAQVSAADKQEALRRMTPAQVAAVASYEATCKALAAARVEGATTERWTVTGTASKV